MLLVQIKLLLTAVFWGGTFIAGRVVARHIDPFSAAFLRFAIALVFLVAVTYRIEKRLPPLDRRQWIPVILLGLTGIFAYNVFFFSGLHYIGAGRAALIIANNPIFISLFSAWFFREKLTRIKIIGIILSVLGALVVISNGRPEELFRGGFGRGEFYIFMCVATWVAYSLIGKALMTRLSALAAVTYSCLVGTAALLPVALFRGLAGNILQLSLPEWGGLLYLGFFGTVLGFLWYYQGIRAIGPTRAAVFINFVPISAVLLAFLLLNESLTVSLLSGMALVSSGVYLTNKRIPPGNARTT